MFSSDADWSVYEKLARTVEPAGEEESPMVDVSGDLTPALERVDGFLAGAGGARRRSTRASTRRPGPGQPALRRSRSGGGEAPRGAAAPATEAAILAFNREIIAATAEHAVAYKPNLAFYEALGPAGLEALRQTLRAIPPGIVVIGDAKRGDIANTMRLYARALLDVYGFDAVTASPDLGRDALAPLLERTGSGRLRPLPELKPRSGGDCQPERGRATALPQGGRASAGMERAGQHGAGGGGDRPSGVGRRPPDGSGSAHSAARSWGARVATGRRRVAAGLDGQGRGLLVVAARQVLYASSGADFPEAARRRAAASLEDRVNQVRRGARAATTP